jgi:hypothetical protein
VTDTVQEPCHRKVAGLFAFGMNKKPGAMTGLLCLCPEGSELVVYAEPESIEICIRSEFQRTGTIRPS